ncbi:protein IQ-DOMAIN 14-like isoform X1 [Camellia sinensis]|uniref:protein IQ-DOMAIN 14-like isoform X1 n=1 Tax=Camellia sinensis TaxID=4442 RepID=UPI00103614BD|nr:protein IQ-DOMAIN 14-like isoform X1 [Camellia sinensis]
MDKAAKWFRGLFGLKKDHSPSQSAAKPPKRRWSFVKSHSERDRTPTKNTTTDDAVDPSKHAITAAEKITSSGRSNATTATSAAYVSEWAVITIQAHFRGHLARRALRALKGLVKLQALVRGHIVRKRTVELAQILQAMYRAQARACARRAQISESPHSSNKSSQFQARRELRALKGLVKLQALVIGHIVRKRTVDVVQRLQDWLRAQARACAGRTQISESPHSSNKSSQFQGPATPVKFERAISSKIAKHDQSPMLLKQRSSSKSTARVIIHQDKAHNDWMELDHKMDEGSWDRKRPHGLALDQCNHSFSTSKDSTAHPTVPSPSSCEVHSLCPLKSMQGNTEESPFCTANNGPQFYSASSRSGSPKRGPFTPSKSDGSRSSLSCHYPNCMACTESSRAKVMSLSAPKQRPQFESSVSSKRYSVHGYGESRSSSLRVSANFANKAYLGSGRLERLGMPVRGEVHSLCPLKSMQGNTEESPFCTANNGPQFYSASSRSGSPKRGPFTPSKSDGSRSNLSCHYPNCMACTESSRAKVRSLSAPNKGPNLRALFHPKGTQFMGMVSPDQSLSVVWSFGEAWNACDRRCNLAQCWPLEQILE